MGRTWIALSERAQGKGSSNMLKSIAWASLSIGALLCAAPSGLAQELVVVPDAPGSIGPGTQGWIVYRGVPFPPFSGFFWFCGGGNGVSDLSPAGEVAEEVHMLQGGELASVTFTYRVWSQSHGGSGPPSGSATAVLRVYGNDATDSILPSAGSLLGTWSIPVNWVDDAWQVVTYDIPVPINVPKDLWIGIEIDSPPGTAGSLGGKGAGGTDPTVLVGSSHNLTWFGPSACEAVGHVVDNMDYAGFIGNYGVDVRVFPVVDCEFPIADGDFEGGTFGAWTAIGRSGVVTAEQVNVGTTSGVYQAAITNGDAFTDLNGGLPLPGVSGTSQSIGTLEGQLGLAGGTLASLASPGSPAEGSAIKQTLNVAAGDTLHLRWSFLTNEFTPEGTFNDFAFVTIGGSAFLLADTAFPAFVPSQSVHFQETGYQTFEHQFTSPGSVTIGLGVVDQFDGEIHSSLLVDCVELIPGAPSNSPPTCSADLAAAEADFLQVAPGEFVVTAGETIVVPFTGSDPDGGNLMVSVAGLPPGASCAPLSGSAPLTSTLVWTPQAGDKAGAPWVVSVTFSDASGASSSCSVTIADVNLAPICAGQDVIAQATSPLGCEVQLTGLAADADDPSGNLVYEWFVSDASVVLDDPSSPTPTGWFPIGVTTATVSVADQRGGVSVCDALVTVQDSQPPEVLCTTDLAALWPPKHALQSVTLVVTATDACANPGTILPITVRVSSSEPDDAPGSGDGQTSGDVHGLDGFAAPVDVTPSFTFDALTGQWTGTVLLRAERLGSGTGRKYTIDVSALDSSGNETTSSCCVIVPHDRRASTGL
jgi:hypothetical protein